MSNFTPLPVGTVLDNRYKLVEDEASRKPWDKHVLGKGGMGAVYLAHDMRLNCAVAVKQTTVSSDILELNAFRREASLLANLSHPAIPRVQDYFDDNNSYFLVMELVRGDNLEEARNKRGGKLPFEEVLHIAFQLLDTLNYLHTQTVPIIHRDIKPLNLKLTAHAQLKLLDFGLAKGSAGLMTTHLDSLLKGGTPGYAPPEQLKYFSTDARSDLYSTAATLYHLAVGERPAHCLIDREFAIQKGMPDPLRLANEINPNVPPEFALILRQALSLSPDERPASAAEMKKQLTDWQKAEIEDQRRADEAERIRLQKEIEEAQRQAEAERKLRLEEQKKREEHNKSANNNLPMTLAGASLVGTVVIGLMVLSNFSFNNTNSNNGNIYSSPTPITKSSLPLTISSPFTIPSPFSSIAAASPSPTIDYFQRGYECNVEKKDYDCAIINYSKYIELNPNNVVAYHNRGNAYANKGNYEQAIKDYNKAIELNPNYAEAYYGRGYVYNNKSDYEQAIKDYTKAIELSPQNAGAYNNRGIAYKNKGNYEQAIKDYTKAIELKQDDPLYYQNRANALEKKGEITKAQADRRKAVELEKRTHQ